jgi:hypothetical protein
LLPGNSNLLHLSHLLSGLPIRITLMRIRIKLSPKFGAEADFSLQCGSG